MHTTIAVTGATAGLGEAMARRFARAGARLVLIARRAARLETLREELGPRLVHTLACDIGEVGAYTAALRALPAEFAAIDVLVNNAGIAVSREPAPKTRLEDWLAMIDTNIRGLVAGTHAVLPGMIERGRGHIVNIGSTAGAYPNTGNVIYGPTKAFVRQFSLNLRADLLGTPIRVTDVEPGVTRTDFPLVRHAGDAAMAAATYEGITPLAADDVADAVEWAITRPAHVNVNIVQVMPVDQAFGPPALYRRTSGGGGTP